MTIPAEVLGEDDESCSPGVRGEVTLTCGRNPFAPLLRYRTGDFAALAPPDDGPPVLVGLDGRDPVLFPTRDGRLVHGMEVARRPRPLPLVQFRLHQDAEDAEGLFHFSYRGEVDRDTLWNALSDLLGPANLLTITLGSDPSIGPGKVREVSSERAVAGFPGPDTGYQ
ncbi:MAG TPA: hypothetical protein VF590_10150 [Isosphaeraceae bacterium]|jgi:phenylacetate-CoA ligase